MRDYPTLHLDINKSNEPTLHLDINKSKETACSKYSYGSKRTRETIPHYT
jgi:hypothetical protein